MRGRKRDHFTCTFFLYFYPLSSFKVYYIATRREADAFPLARAYFLFLVYLEQSLMGKQVIQEEQEMSWCLADIYWRLVSGCTVITSPGYFDSDAREARDCQRWRECERREEERQEQEKEKQRGK